MEFWVWGFIYKDYMTLEPIFVYIIAPLLVLFLVWLVNQIWLKTQKPIVLVHEAFFSNTPKPYYFIKVQNHSQKYNFTITHVWIEDKEKVHIVNNNRPLPKKLKPTDEWETWIEKSKITDKDNVYFNVRVKLSDNRILKSKLNKKVPSQGYVAG